MRRLVPLVLLSTIAIAAQACSGEPAAEDGELVQDLSYFSASSVEYTVRGRASLELEPEYATKTPAQRLARAKELVRLKNVQISFFLNTYLQEKYETDKNAAYGGFDGIVGFGSEQADGLRADATLKFSYDYQVMVGGPRSLLGRIEGTAQDGKKVVPLMMARVSNETLAELEYNEEWYENEPFKSFAPERVGPGEVESIDLTFEPSPSSSDAYLPYDKLFADGQLTIGLHFGYDYIARNDIWGSRLTYEWLVDEQGWTSPVTKYEKLDQNSGPLTKTLRAGGKSVEAKLWLFHAGRPDKGIPGPNPDTDPGGKQLEKDFRTSLAEREVILFEGHSGATYGFPLANWKKTTQGDVDDSELPGATMPETFQFISANGCQSFGVGATFALNPAKAPEKHNLNVLTTLGFANGGQLYSTFRVIEALTNQKNGRLVPQKLSQLTSGLDRDQGPGFRAMYGAHGIEANPRRDPLADVTTLCHACSDDAGCGEGNRCTQLSSRQRVCTLGCTDSVGCPSGYACKAVGPARSNIAATMQCVPTTMSCGR